MSSSSTGPIHVQFRGPLRIVTRDGADLTPRSARARALVAVLASDSRRPRSRRWIEAMLWPDKPADKASMSLRQILTELRGSLAEYAGILGADRHTVWMDPDLILTDLDAGPGSRVGCDILEGFDIGAPEFEEWLRQLRSSLARDEPEESTAQGNLRLVARVGEASDPTARITAGLIADQIGRNLEDGVGAVRAGGAIRGRDIEIIANSSEGRGHALISARVIYRPEDVVLFSGFRSIPVSGSGPSISDDAISAFAHEAAARAIDRLPGTASAEPEAIATGYCEAAKRRIFSYEPAALAGADDLLRRAFDTDPNGLYLAWRAFLRASEVIEGMARATPALLQETDYHLRRAVELAGDNAQVHALTALVRLLLFDDPHRALSAAEAGVRRNPQGLLARQAFAMAAGSLGDDETAYRASASCRLALQGEDARHLWDLYHGLVCLRTRRWAEARSALELALMRRPSFRAPHRQMIALSLHLGDAATAARHLSAMQALEPGFALSRYANDPDYPTTTLRKVGLLEKPFTDMLDERA